MVVALHAAVAVAVLASQGIAAAAAVLVVASMKQSPITVMTLVVAEWHCMHCVHS